MLNLIKDLSNSYAISGYEDELLEIIKKHSTNLKVTTDPMFNIYLQSKKQGKNKLTVMLDGHLVL